MVGQRRRRCAKFSPALGQRLVFDRLHDTKGEPACPHLPVRGET